MVGRDDEVGYGQSDQDKEHADKKKVTDFIDAFPFQGFTGQVFFADEGPNWNICKQQDDGDVLGGTCGHALIDNLDPSRGKGDEYKQMAYEILKVGKPAFGMPVQKTGPVGERLVSREQPVASDQDTEKTGSASKKRVIQRASPPGNAEDKNTQGEYRHRPNHFGRTVLLQEISVTGAVFV